MWNHCVQEVCGEGFTPKWEEEDRAWQRGRGKIQQRVSQGLDSQEEVSGCSCDCWSPGEAGGSVYVPYSLFEHFPVLSRKDPVSPVWKEVLSYVYLIQTGPHLLTPSLTPTESLCRMKCLPPMGSGGLSRLFSL